MNIPYRSFGGQWPGQAFLLHRFQARGFSQQGAKQVAQGEPPKQPVDKLKVVNAPAPPAAPAAKPASGGGQTAGQGQGGSGQTAGQGNLDAIAMDRLTLAKLKMSMATGSGETRGQGQAG
jgi:hypothetical protein